MIRVTVVLGGWVIFHLVLFARPEEQENSQENASLTGIGGGDLAVDTYEKDYAEETAESRFGFGVRR